MPRGVRAVRADDGYAVHSWGVMQPQGTSLRVAAEVEHWLAPAEIDKLLRLPSYVWDRECLAWYASAV